MTRVRALLAQLQPMKQMIGQLKKDKDGAKKKIISLEKEMEIVMEKIQVRVYLNFILTIQLTVLYDKKKCYYDVQNGLLHLCSKSLHLKLTMICHLRFDFDSNLKTVL